jgi:shikimate kinase
MDELLQGLNIYLIGMMGSGKTTVGNAIAHRLNYRFFDTDDLIERVTGQTVNEIFATLGETKFRDLETEVLMQLAAYTRSAIATGGGIVLRQRNWSYLRHGVIVWLDVPVQVLVERLAQDSTRPLLNESDPAVKLSEIFAQRRSLYALADLHIQVQPEQAPNDIAQDILLKIPTILKEQPASFPN